MKAVNILITGAGTTNAMGIAKVIRREHGHGTCVLMADMEPDCAGAFLGDRYLWLPPAHDLSFPEVAKAVCRQHKIDLVIPVIDDELLIWSNLKKELAENGTRVAISDPEVIARCQQKDQAMAWLQSMGAPCPETWRLEEIKDPERLPYPLIVKPRCGRGSIDVHRLNDVRDYRYYTRSGGDRIVQPCLAGFEVSVDTLSDFQGRFVGAVARKRTEIKSGQAIRSTTFASPDLIRLARQIVEGLPIQGPANLQCFLTDQGPVFFEINPRLGAGAALSIYAGLDIPGALLAMLQGEKVPCPVVRPNVQMLRYYEEVFHERQGVPIFLDLDGPILDVSHRHYQVYCDILHENGKPFFSYQEHWEAKRARRSLRQMVSEAAGEEFADQYFLPEWFDRIESDNYLDYDRVWSWAIEILAELRRRHPLYLVTVRSKPDQLHKQLKRLHLDKWFEKVLCQPARENAGRRKAEAIGEYFDTIPSQAVMVGDTEADAECGQELGFVTVGVLSGIRNRQQLEQCGWTYLLEDIRALPELVSGLYGEQQ